MTLACTPRIVQTSRSVVGAPVIMRCKPFIRAGASFLSSKLRYEVARKICYICTTKLHNLSRIAS